MFLVVSLVLSFLFFEILAFCLRLTIRLGSLMMPNPDGGSSSTGNGNNKPNTD
jgi:hypothetical protein